jgi:hypothetical protein
MKIIPLMLVALFAFNSATATAVSDENASVEPMADFLSVNVDRVVIDTAGLATASETLAASVDGLAHAISQLSAENTNLTEEQKQILLDAVQSVDKASVALTELSRQLPGSAQGLSEQLPGMIDSAREPLADLSSGLDSARDSIQFIIESLPQATENAEQLVNATLDAAVLRLSIYTFVLLAAIALALIGIVWFLYWQYLGPLMRKLDELVGAPEHFENMARHMKETSDNLLSLQRSEQSAGGRGLGRLQRQ